MENRLSRIQLMIGREKLKVLQNAHVCVIGCGAVGSFAIEALARSGIGHLTLIDFDTVSVSNINRQLFALNSTIGQEKTLVAKTRIHDISPDIKADILNLMVNQKTVNQILDLQPDFVVDAIDSLNPKVCLIETLVKANIPFVSCMGAALKTQPELIQITTMKKTKNDPLAAFIRKYLRRRNIPLNFPVVYSPELSQDKSKLELPDEVPPSGRIRHKMGSLPTITGIFGLTCAQVVLDTLIKNINDS